MPSLTASFYPPPCLQDFNAKLSDFGLARDGPLGNKTHVTTDVIGTKGYIDPGYLVTGEWIS